MGLCTLGKVFSKVSLIENIWGDLLISLLWVKTQILGKQNFPFLNLTGFPKSWFPSLFKISLGFNTTGCWGPKTLFGLDSPLTISGRMLPKREVFRGPGLDWG